MNGTTPIGEIAAEVKNDPASRARIDAQKQAMDDALALNALRDRVQHAHGCTPMVLDLSEAADAVANRSHELYLLTLQHYVAEMGGHLVVEAVFPDVRVNFLRRRDDSPNSPVVDPAEQLASPSRSTSFGIGLNRSPAFRRDALPSPNYRAQERGRG